MEKARSKVDESKLREEKTADTVQAEPGSIIPDTEQAETMAEPVEERIFPLITETIDQPTEKELLETKEQQEQVTETERLASDKVTVEEVNAAVFDSATDKIIFTKALSDLASQGEMVRIDAAKAIGSIRHELSVRALVARMAIESIPQVRSECIKALAVLNMKEGLSAVEHALTDEAGLVRLAAVWGLYRLAGAESGPALICMLADEDEEVRRRTTTCIGWLGKEELATAVVPMLDDSSISVRQVAIESMANLRCQAVVPALIEHLSAPEKIIRKTVIAALKTITGKKMSCPFPKDEKSLQQLIVRWRLWWQGQYLE